MDKYRKYSMKKRKFLIFLKKVKRWTPATVMVILCLIAFSITISIMIDNARRNYLVQEIRDDDWEHTTFEWEEQIDAGELITERLVLNGNLKENVPCYLFNNISVYMPLEELFSLFGIDYDLYMTDNFVTFELSSGFAQIHIGKPDIEINGMSVDLQGPVIIKDGCILITHDIIDHIGGYVYQTRLEDGFLYFNYIKTDRIDLGRNSDLIIFTKKGENYDSAVIELKTGVTENDAHFPLENGKLTENGEITKNKKIAGEDKDKINFSKDGKNVYWYNEDGRNLNIFSSEDPILRTFYEIDPSEVENTFKLKEFYINGEIQTIILYNEDHEYDYIIIEKDGNREFSGYGKVSPDRRKYIYKNENNMIFLADIDVGIEYPIMEGRSFRWINNEEIFIINKNDIKYVWNVVENSSEKTENDCGFISGTKDNGCIFYEGEEIYLKEAADTGKDSANAAKGGGKTVPGKNSVSKYAGNAKKDTGAEKKKLNISFKDMNYLFYRNVRDQEFAYLVNLKAGLYFIKENKYNYITSTSFLFSGGLNDDSLKQGIRNDLLEQCLTISPDDAKTVIFNKDERILQIKIVDNFKEYPVVADLQYSFFSSNEDQELNYRWIDDHMIAVFSQNKVILLDLKSDVDSLANSFVYDIKEDVFVAGIKG